MATISSVVAPVKSQGNPGRSFYVVEKEIDFSDISVDPSAGDIVQAITIPANTILLTAGLEVTEALSVTGGTDAVCTLGTDTDADEYVTGFDADAATAGDYAPMAAGALPEIVGTENTLDLTFSATNVSSIDSGKFRVFAVLISMDALGSDKTADEVVRDQLA